jgi:hypothetical protein
MQPAPGFVASPLACCLAPLLMIPFDRSLPAPALYLSSGKVMNDHDVVVLAILSLQSPLTQSSPSPCRV